MNRDSTAAAAMTADVVTVRPTCTVTDAATLLARNRIGMLPVVDPGGRLLGVLSESDIVWLRAHEDRAAPGRPRWWDQSAPDECTVEEVYSPGPITVAPDEPLEVVRALMREHHIHHVVVVDGERRPIGVVGTLDVLERAA